VISKISEEFLDISFGDKRLDCRFKKIANQLSSNMGASIPLACEDWANTKAAYRFFKNKKITLDKILDPHKFSTHGRKKRMMMNLHLYYMTRQNSLTQTTPQLRI